jgi:hypothetical protein
VTKVTKEEAEKSSAFLAGLVIGVLVVIAVTLPAVHLDHQRRETHQELVDRGHMIYHPATGKAVWMSEYEEGQ